WGQRIVPVHLAWIVDGAMREEDGRILGWIKRIRILAIVVVVSGGTRLDVSSIVLWRHRFDTTLSSTMSVDVMSVWVVDSVDRVIVAKTVEHHRQSSLVVDQILELGLRVGLIQRAEDVQL